MTGIEQNGEKELYTQRSLLGDTAPTTPQTTTPSSSAGGNSSTQQPSGGNGQTTQPSGGSGGALTPEEQADFDAFIQSIGDSPSGPTEGNGWNWN